MTRIVCVNGPAIGLLPVSEVPRDHLRGSLLLCVPKMMVLELANKWIGRRFLEFCVSKSGCWRTIENAAEGRDMVCLRVTSGKSSSRAHQGLMGQCSHASHDVGTLHHIVAWHSCRISL